jgi:AraC-like DNA-binding protein
MVYRNLDIYFMLDGIRFTINSIAFETIITPFPKHCHSKSSLEIHYISNGEGTLTTDEGSHHLRPGMLYITGPGAYHSQISDYTHPMSEYSLYFNFDIIDSASYNHSFVGKQLLHEPFCICEDRQNLAVILSTLCRELSEKEMGYKTRSTCILQEILVLIARTFSPACIIENDNPVNDFNQNKYLMIEEAFLYDYKTISLTELSNRLSVSTRQTERLLMKYYGMTFSEKRTEARMSAALSLLENTDFTTSYISEMLGYSSVEYFAESCRQYYGKSPGKLRHRKCAISSADTSDVTS